MEDDSDGEDTPGSTPRAADAEKAGGGGDDDDEDSDSEGDISSDDESSGSDVDEVRPHKKELSFFVCSATLSLSDTRMYIQHDHLPRQAWDMHREREHSAPDCTMTFCLSV